MSQQSSDLKIDSYKKRALPLKPRPNSIYYILPEKTSEVIVYITDLSGNPIKVIDIKSLASVLSVRGTGVTGTTTNPKIDIETFVSSQIGNLIELSTQDGKLVVKPITSPDESIEVNSTSSGLQIKISQDILDRINNALQAGDPVSSLTNDAGYVNEETLASLQSQVDNLSHNELAGLNTGNFIHLTAAEKSRLGILESTANKQNSLTHDGTGILYPTVDAVNRVVETIIEAIEVAKDKHYVHNQVATSMTWVILHNLRKHPAVTIVDSANNIVIGDCEYNSDNQLTMTFTASFSGKAYLN